MADFQLLMDPEGNSNNPQAIEKVLRTAIVNDDMDMTVKPNSLRVDSKYCYVICLKNVINYIYCFVLPYYPYEAPRALVFHFGWALIKMLKNSTNDSY